MRERLPERTTRLLSNLGAVDPAVQAGLVAQLYDELHAIAGAHMARESSGHTLQPTALVNEAWLRLARIEGSSYPSRQHFYAMASKVMRDVLVDHARAKKAKKRGGDRVRVPLVHCEDEPAPPPRTADLDLVDLDQALEELERVDPELVPLVELRFFAGLPMKDIAAATKGSQRTVERRLMVATAWLRERLG